MTLTSEACYDVTDDNYALVDGGGGKVKTTGADAYFDIPTGSTPDCIRDE